MRLSNPHQQKIYTKESLAKSLYKWKFFGKKIVFTNGCFDLLHAGHIHSLSQAAALGDVLIVGLNSDASVKRLKGERRPLQTETDRATILASLYMVDAVIIFENDTPLEIIEFILPDVLAKGGDYSPETVVGAKEVIENGGRVEIIPLIPGLSTTRLEQSLKI
ncbi:MAG: D-glycero-beta-D-manno-heptose 1-phosphate adenylyltransferase [Bacteroidetes bacterium]|nr:D-glycero-beta-D-manno-heptose 1-phosphate adenylyltransferase [Bacteroidota bacterium]